MKFQCEKPALAKAMSNAAKAGGGSGFPTLLTSASLRLTLDGDRLDVSAHNRDTYLRSTVAVAGSEDGDSVVPSKLACSVVQSLDDCAISVASDGEQFSVTHQGAEFDFPEFDLDKYPTFESPSDANSLDVDAEVLVKAAKQTIMAASGDTSRPVLTGIQLSQTKDTLSLAATDGYRLALRRVAGLKVLADNQSAIVPVEALRHVVFAIGSSGDITACFDEKLASFAGEDAEIRTRLIDGAFPEIESLISEKRSKVTTVNRLALLNACTRATLMSDQHQKAIKLTIKKKNHILIASNTDIGNFDADVACSHEGDPITLGLNADFLIDGLKSFDEDEVTIHTESPEKSVFIKAAETDGVYLLMPIRL